MIPRFGANPRRSRPRPLTGPAPPCTLPGSPGARPGRHWPGRGGGGGVGGGEAACPGGIPGNRPSSRRPQHGVRALVAHAPSAIWFPRSSAPPLRPPCAPHRWEAKRRRPGGQGGR